MLHVFAQVRGMMKAKTRFIERNLTMLQDYYVPWYTKDHIVTNGWISVDGDKAHCPMHIRLQERMTQGKGLEQRYQLDCTGASGPIVTRITELSEAKRMLAFSLEMALRSDYGFSCDIDVKVHILGMSDFDVPF
jgi:hypothetical protein